MHGFEIFSWVLIGVWAVALFPVLYGILFPRFLRDVLPCEGDNLPSISVIVPARDEAVAIEEALRRMRASDDEALSLRQGLTDAKDDVAAGRAAFGEHHLTVMVRGQTQAGSHG